MNRLSILTSLVEFNMPLPVLEDALSALDWDADPAVTLKREHVAAVLRRFQVGELDAPAVEAWANLVECREDIVFEPRHEAIVTEAIHDIANPEPQGRLRAITPDVLAKLER